VRSDDLTHRPLEVGYSFFPLSFIMIFNPSMGIADDALTGKRGYRLFHAHRVDVLACAARHRCPRGIVGIACVPSSSLPAHCRCRHPHVVVTLARAPSSTPSNIVNTVVRAPSTHPRPSAPAHIRERVRARLVQSSLSVWLHKSTLCVNVMAGAEAVSPQTNAPLNT